MPVPPNTSFGTAIDLGTLPATLTGIDASDGAGTNYDLYYKFTAPTDARVVGAWAFTPIADAFVSTISPYDASQVSILSIAAINVPIQFPVTAGQLHYLKLAKSDNSQPATIDLNVQVAANGSILRGNIIINDDAPGFPTAILSHSADDTYVAFIKDTASGEAGDILPSAIILENNSDTHVKVYDLSFNQLADINLGYEAKIRSCTGQNKFYMVANHASPVELYTVTPAGVQSGIIANVAGGSPAGIESIAAKNDGLILYWANKGNGVAIKRWDISLDSAMSDLAAAIANYAVPDILYLSDDTIIALYWNSSTKDVQVKQYSTAGATLNTYALGAQTGTVKPRLAYALDNPTSFWVWTHNTGGRSIFRNVKVSDGSILTTRNHQEYEGGVYNAVETATPNTRFGHSFSCPFMIMTSLPQYGILKIVPDKRTDNDGTNTVAIPNPTWKTALLP